MNRREAIIAGMAGITAAVAVVPTAAAQASEGNNPDLDQIRALLRAHDEAFTNHDLNGIMACLTEKAAIMGTGPGEVWSGPEEIKAERSDTSVCFRKKDIAEIRKRSCWEVRRSQ